MWRKLPLNCNWRITFSLIAHFNPQSVHRDNEPFRKVDNSAFSVYHSYHSTWTLTNHGPRFFWWACARVIVRTRSSRDFLFSNLAGLSNFCPWQPQMAWQPSVWPMTHSPIKCIHVSEVTMVHGSSHLRNSPGQRQFFISVLSGLWMQTIPAWICSLTCQTGQADLSPWWWWVLLMRSLYVLRIYLRWQ